MTTVNGERLVFHNMHVFNSSVLVSGEYLRTNGTAAEGHLQVTLRNGQTYVYANVPNEVWVKLKNSKSAGRYFAQQIRGHYPTALFVTKKVVSRETLTVSPKRKAATRKAASSKRTVAKKGATKKTVARSARKTNTATRKSTKR